MNQSEKDKDLEALLRSAGASFRLGAERLCEAELCELREHAIKRAAKEALVAESVRSRWFAAGLCRMFDSIRSLSMSNPLLNDVFRPAPALAVLVLILLSLTERFSNSEIDSVTNPNVSTRGIEGDVSYEQFVFADEIAASDEASDDMFAMANTDSAREVMEEIFSDDASDSFDYVSLTLLESDFLDEEVFENEEDYDYA